MTKANFLVYLLPVYIGTLLHGKCDKGYQYAF